MIRVVVLQKYLAPYRVPLFNRLARQRDIDLTVLYYGREEQRRRWTVFPDKAFREVQSRCIGVRAGYERNIELPLSLLSDLARRSPDCIICTPDIGGAAAYVHSRSRRSRLIIWSEAIPLTERRVNGARLFLRRLLYGRAAAFIVPGQLAADYIRTFQPGASISFAPNAIDEESFAVAPENVRDKFQRERLIITFSGSLIERKGVPLLLKAYRRLLEERPRMREKCLLRILGTGPLAAADAREHGIEFSGFCEGQRYRDYLRESHLLVLPSLHDNNPLTVVEGLFAGNVPLLADGVGNHPEAVKGNGLVVPAGSERELYGALSDLLLRSREDLTRMALRSLALARDFSLERSAAGFVEAIGSAMTVPAADETRQWSSFRA
jgi:glycosyltransferase involved in cell wall biosynthesis